MEKRRDKRIISVLMTLTIIFTLMGGTLSYLRWQTSEGQKTNVVFTVNSSFSCAADGGGNIESATLVPASCTNSKYAIQRIVTVTPEIKGNGLAISMDLWLDINKLGSGLSQSEHFRYALTTVENDCTTGIVTEGRFTGLSSENNDKVMLLNGQKYTTSKSDKYYLYIWIDPLEENDYIVDQSFNFSLGGNCSELYTVNYDLNGGEGTVVNQYKASNETITLSNEVPTRSGYTFVGWTTSPTATIAEYQPGDEYILDENTTLYAIWEMLSPLESYSCANESTGSEPYTVTYTGNCTMIDDGDGNWRMKLLSNGTFITITDIQIDTFLVGGGGAGASNTTNYGSGGGGGGYTKTQNNISIDSNSEYEIVIGKGGSGSDGGSTSAFGFSVNGGKKASGRTGGAGGSGGGGGGYSSNNSGGGGGSDGKGGGNGGTEGGKGGTGQGTTTREFGESTGTLYAGGGGGGASFSANGNWSSAGAGGSGGGARGSGSSAAANTGGGGGGGSEEAGGGAGGSGIVVIRNSKINCSSDIIENAPFEFEYSGNCTFIDDGAGNWRIKFLTSGNLRLKSTPGEIDLFLVGGGGSGESNTTNYGGGGGGGGYTKTEKSINLNINIDYEIVIGKGGVVSDGESTSAFSFSVNGGKKASGKTGGNGGSGGGGGGYSSNNNGGGGGSDGKNGGNGGTEGGIGGSGQGTTTREFGESTGALYGGGGGGGASFSANGNWSSAGAGGGGGGARGSGSSASANTGGGGGGGSEEGAGGYGGSGIVIIRNKR